MFIYIQLSGTLIRK